MRDFLQMNDGMRRMGKRSVGLSYLTLASHLSSPPVEPVCNTLVICSFVQEPQTPLKHPR